MELTPKQVARAIGVSDASLKRWCDKGVLPAYRTAGGHRRLPLSGVVEFLRKSGRRLVDPAVLGLPPVTGSGTTVVSRAATQLVDAMRSNDESQYLRIVFDLYLAGQRVREICDRVVSPALCEVGELWHSGKLDVFEERRASEITMRTLYRLAAFMPPVGNDAPRAVGGNYSGDNHVIPSIMVELALREIGWRADSYGPNLPQSSLCELLRRDRPRLFWLSVSWIADPTEFLAGCDRVFATASELGVAVVVGGRQLSEDVRRQMRYSAFCDHLEHVAAFARTLQPDTPEPTTISNAVDDAEWSHVAATGLNN